MNDCLLAGRAPPHRAGVRLGAAPPAAQPPLQGDASAARRVLLRNLLDNALRYAPQGSIGDAALRRTLARRSSNDAEPFGSTNSSARARAKALLPARGQEEIGSGLGLVDRAAASPALHGRAGRAAARGAAARAVRVRHARRRFHGARPHRVSEQRARFLAGGRCRPRSGRAGAASPPSARPEVGTACAGWRPTVDAGNRRSIAFVSSPAGRASAPVRAARRVRGRRSRAATAGCGSKRAQA